MDIFEVVTPESKENIISSVMKILIEFLSFVLVILLYESSLKTLFCIVLTFLVGLIPLDIDRY